jgi:NADPH:quinone reductase-like Zn-dependent oxidoreductase
MSQAPGHTTSPAAAQLRALMLSPFTRQRLTTYVSWHRQADLDTLRQLTETGQLTPHIGQTYPLADLPVHDLHAGHARGKIAITI